MKGGAAGGGYAQVLPMEKINLHFTGDFHAITSAHNMISALLDNYLYQNQSKGFGLKEILWRRVLDVNDRSLRNIVVGLGPKTNGITQESDLILLQHQKSWQFFVFQKTWMIFAVELKIFF